MKGMWTFINVIKDISTHFLTTKKIFIEFTINNFINVPTELQFEVLYV
jgi:hypothetical protein